MAFPFAASRGVWARVSGSTRALGRRLLPFKSTATVSSHQALTTPPANSPHSLSGAIRSINQRQERNRFQFEGMEPRLLMSADPYQLVSGADVTLRVTEDEDQQALVQLLDNDNDSSVLQEWNLEDLGASITLDGTSGEETLALDSSLTDLDSPLLVVFNALGGDDTLQTPAALIDAVDNPNALIDWTLTGSKSGHADLDGSANNTSVVFSEVDNILAGDGDDQLAALANSNWQVLGANSLLVNGINFSGVESLNASANDQLDYSAYTGAGVTVDLSQGLASGFSGISGFVNVVGSAQDDLLIGDGNINTLSGGDGHDQLQGGLGNDTLIGGEGNDTVLAERASDMTLLDGSLSIGTELDSLASIESAQLTITGAVGYTLDASSFSLGGVTLSGGEGGDFLIGTDQDDRFIGGEGNDTITGNGQVLLDIIVAERDLDMTLVHTNAATGSGSLSIGLGEVDTFSGIETAFLIGGESGNLLDASGFDNVGVFDGIGITLDGAAGNDTLLGSQDDDFITGDLGLDTIDGNAGSDSLIETGDNRFVIQDSGTLGSAGTLDRGDGVSEIQTLLLTGATDGYFTLMFGGEETTSIDYDASADEFAVALRSLSTIHEEDVVVDKITDGWRVYFVNNMAASNIDMLALGATNTTGVAPLISASSAGDNEVQLISRFGATAGDFTLSFGTSTTNALSFDATAAQIQAELEGLLVIGAGNLVVEETSDREFRVEFIGGSVAKSDVDLISVNDNTVDGLFEVVAIREGVAAQLNTDGSTILDSFISIEKTELYGRESANLIDASGFTGNAYLWGWAGDDILIGGAGVDTLIGAAGNDILDGGAGSENYLFGDAGFDTVIARGEDGENMTLTDASLTIGVNTHWLNEIETAELTAGDGGVVVDAGDFSGVTREIYLQWLNNGNGIGSVAGTDFSLSFSNDAANPIDVDFSYATTIEDILEILSALDSELSANLTTTGAISLTDSSASGRTISISSVGRSTAAADLGLAGLVGVDASASWSGDGIVAGYVTLIGGSGSDELIGTRGNDYFTGGRGSDTIRGAKAGAADVGVDTFYATVDADLYLSADRLEIDTNNDTGTFEETDTLIGIDKAELAGGSSANIIDASGFTGDSVILYGAAGDTLVGTEGSAGTADAEFRIDISDIDVSDMGIDDTDLVSIQGSKATDRIVLQEVGSSIDSSIFDYVQWTGHVVFSIESDGSLTLAADLVVPQSGSNTADIQLFADDRLHISYDISTQNVGGDAGNITLTAKHIVIDSDAAIDASSVGGEAGDIAITASDLKKDFIFFGFANVDYNEASVTIGDATLDGRNVSIKAESKADHYLKSDSNPVSKALASGVDAITGILEPLSLLVGVAVATSKADINIGSGAVINAYSFDAHADANAFASAKPISWVLGIAVGVVNTQATLTVDGEINTDQNASLQATGEAALDVIADAGGKKELVGGIKVPAALQGVAASVAAAAMAGIPVHVITVNDYLSKRDCEEMSPLYQALGFSVGCVEPGMTPDQRRQVYACDIVYCTNNELVFDYLKDYLVWKAAPDVMHRYAERLKGNETLDSELVMRGLHYAIIDEADSICMDEARTPLIISANNPANDTEALMYQQALDIASQLQEDTHYTRYEKLKQVEFKDAGEELIDRLASSLGAYWVGRVRRYELVRQALIAQLFFLRDRHYLVRDEKVQIIDEHTGRVMADRSWEKGLHQLLEIKEGCPNTASRETLAKVSYQRFFRRYRFFAGMTGTAKEVRQEFWDIYQKQVCGVSTHHPLRRLQLGSRLLATQQQQMAAIVSAARVIVDQGRSVMIGTSTVGASERVAQALAAGGITAQLLNAKQDHLEAEIIAEAGQPGRVTIATSMAGRGTDIKLHPEVERRGGLHVILSELQDAGRIDRQLAGRCARFGDPGSVELIVSLDDEWLSDHWTRPWLSPCLGVSWGQRIGLLIMKWQQKMRERRHKKMRYQLLKTDEQKGETLAFTQGSL